MNDEKSFTCISLDYTKKVNECGDSGHEMFN